jgi:hypothetical protein
VTKAIGSVGREKSAARQLAETFSAETLDSLADQGRGQIGDPDRRCGWFADRVDQGGARTFFADRDDSPSGLWIR